MKRVVPSLVLSDSAALGPGQSETRNSKLETRKWKFERVATTRFWCRGFFIRTKSGRVMRPWVADGKAHGTDPVPWLPVIAGVG